MGGDATCEAQQRYAQKLTEDTIVARLSRPESIRSISAVIARGAKELLQTNAVSAGKLNAKFSQESSFKLSVGSLDVFYGGLERLLGPPRLLNNSLFNRMEMEHCKQTDSLTSFTSSNGMTSTSSDEWEFVVKPEPKKEYAERDDMRQFKLVREQLPYQALLALMEEQNGRLRRDGHEELIEEEVVGARLYTGPMYEKYNLSLRSKSGDEKLIDRFNAVCMGNLYTTTIHAINSCIVKMSKLMMAKRVYRGSVRAHLPEEFLTPNEFGIRGGVEYGFMSTTSDQSQAAHYAHGAASTVFEMDMGMIDRGADVSWLSQYKHEKEILFPPLVGIEVKRMHVRASTLVVEVRISLNLMALTLEQVLNKMKHSHVSMLETLVNDHEHNYGTDADKLAHARVQLAPLLKLVERANDTDGQLFNDPNVLEKRTIEAMDAMRYVFVQDRLAEDEGMRIPKLELGALSLRVAGLEQLIGPPNPDLLDAMAQEHCAGPDAKLMFTTSNYGISTFSPWEWYFVYDPDKGKAEVLPAGQDWPCEQCPVESVPMSEIRENRKAKSPASFSEELLGKNRRLKSVGAKKLETFEFVAARLYTGPMLMKYNAALRACGKTPSAVELFRQLNHGNPYTTSLHLVNSAILKLSKLTSAKIYRGIGGRGLSAKTGTAVELGFLGGTVDDSVARQHAGERGLLLEVQLSAVDGCAHLGWLSQYPHEAAVALPALTALEFSGLELKEGQGGPGSSAPVLLARVKAHLSPVGQTIEQIVGKMQAATLQIIDNVRNTVLQADPPPGALIVLDGIRRTEAARDLAHHNNVSNFRSVIEHALAEREEVFVALAMEETWGGEASGDNSHVAGAAQPLAERMWNAALVPARLGQIDVAINLMRASMRCALKEEVLSITKGQHEQAALKQRMLAQIESALGRDGVAEAGFVSVACELLPSLPKVQAELIFKSCDKDGSGIIEPVEAQEVLEALIKLRFGSQDRSHAKGAKPLFSTRAALDRTKPQWFSLEELGGDASPDSAREREIRAAVDDALAGASSEEQIVDVRLVARLLELGMPQPWPVTLCQLVQGIDGGPVAATGEAPTIGKELVRRIVAAFWEDRMAVGEEVLVLQNGACNLWKKATIEAHNPAPDGKPGCFYDVTFALGHGYPIKGMSANNVLPVEEGGAGALLRAAAAAGDNGLVQALLKAGVHVYEADPDGNTALHAAAGNGHAAVYKTLMDEAGKFPAKKGLPAHAFTKNIRGMRAFDYMVQGHHIRCTRLMRPSAQDRDYIFSASKEMEKLPELLFAACKGGTEQLARAVAEVRKRGEGVDDARTSRGMTALMLACRKGPSSTNRGEGVEDKVRTLLDNGADVNAKSTAGCVALHFAAEAGNPRVVSMLLEKDAEVEALSPDGMTALLLACQNGWTQAAEVLLDACADVNRRQDGGDEFPPIIYAAMNGHTACVDTLIQHKADVNYAKIDGFNALILAAGFNQLALIRRLVRNGARVDDANAKGHTAMLYACITGRGPVVRVLLQLGANPLHLDKEGHSALHLASNGGHSDVVSALLQGLKNQREFDINLTTDEGDSALHLACANGNEEVVGLLVDYEKEKDENMGADQRMRDRNGRDAYAIAKFRGHVPVCVLLQPIREQMITTFTTLNTADAFKRARDFLTVERVNELKRELASVGVIYKDVLSTRPAAGCDAVPSFFTRLSSATVDESQPELFEENKAMWQENELKGRRGQQFLLATWKPSLARVEPSADRESFEGGAAAAEVVPAAPKLSEELGKLGRAPLPERHRFLLLNDDLSWHKFNVLVLGKSGAPNELNEAVKLIEDMKAEALAFAARSGWSKWIGLYFEPYPHASANALYLHIMDEVDPETGERCGPPYELREQLLTMEDVLDVIKFEREVEDAVSVEHTLKED